MQQPSALTSFYENDGIRRATSNIPTSASPGGIINDLSTVSAEHCVNVSG